MSGRNGLVEKAIRDRNASSKKGSVRKAKKENTMVVDKSKSTMITGADGKVREEFEYCQNPNCQEHTVSFLRSKHTGSKKYCAKHAAESRANWKAMIQEQADARAALRVAHISAVDGRLAKTKNGKLSTRGTVIRPMGKRSALHNDILAEYGTVDLVIPAKDDFMTLATINAQLMIAGAKDVFVMVQ